MQTVAEHGRVPGGFAAVAGSSLFANGSDIAKRSLDCGGRNPMAPAIPMVNAFMILARIQASGSAMIIF